jgi:asparagine synthase (glutamine-hydrolysing)
VISRFQLSTREESQVAAMNRQMIHRGPDGEGKYTDRHVSLEMRRLSIIDLMGGWQPFYNQDRSLVLIANGEIYNYIELRQKLKEKGCLFTTESDCEVILHLYELFGLRFVDQLRGMFAIALWDVRRQRLVLARDRMGEKPLYIHQNDCQLFFASELKALLSANIVNFKLDPAAVDRYFHYKYIPEPETAVEGIVKLDAGTLLVIDREEWQARTIPYWRMEEAPAILSDPVETIREELRQVFKMTVRSDVPLGVSLSGGLDSSAIAVMASRERPGAVSAFSVGYTGHPEMDERRLARRLAETLQIPFFEVELKTAEVVEQFPRLVAATDDPIADIAGTGYQAVMALARAHGMRVMMMGHGADELFWGYPWVCQAALRSHRKAAFRKGSMVSLLRYLTVGRPTSLTREGIAVWLHSRAGMETGWNQYLYDQSQPADQLIFYDAMSIFQDARRDLPGLYTASWREQLRERGVTDLFTLPRPWIDLDVTITRLICDTYLRENGITQGDRLSMASSVELRLPFVDYRLVETVIGLRKHHSDIHQEPKYWLREALRPELPSWILERRKRGFTPPTHEWHEAINQRYADLLTDGYLVSQGVLSPVSVKELQNRNSRYQHLFFETLVLELWCRHFQQG